MDKYWIGYADLHPKQSRIMTVVKIALVVLAAIALTGQPIEAKPEEPPVEAEPFSIEPAVGQEEIDVLAEPVDYFVEYFGDKAEEARKVARCESNLNPQAVGRTEDFGMMQLNFPTWGKVFNVSRDELLSEETNIKLAKAIYARAGNWSAWSSSRKCHQLS